MAFFCSICGEESTRICVRCTKDACANHLCDRCKRCSDCCECEVALDAPPIEQPRHHSPTARPAAPEVELAAENASESAPVPESTAPPTDEEPLSPPSPSVSEP